ncbi:MAG: thioredoxin family protein [Bacilli bacterium]|nr:thioredoxin family protein [Bacilli bacterium]
MKKVKIIKISAVWCGACLITDKAWKKLKENYDFESVELDYDMDEEEVAKLSAKTVLPDFIFFVDDQEVDRLVGEVSYEELESKLLEVRK